MFVQVSWRCPMRTNRCQAVIPMAHRAVAALAYFWTFVDSMAPACDRCCKFGVGRSALSVLERWTASDGCDGGVFDSARTCIRRKVRCVFPFIQVLRHASLDAFSRCRRGRSVTQMSVVMHLCAMTGQGGTEIAPDRVF